jgi:hypothetical protein
MTIINREIVLSCVVEEGQSRIWWSSISDRTDAQVPTISRSDIGLTKLFYSDAFEKPPNQLFCQNCSIYRASKLDSESQTMAFKKD